MKRVIRVGALKKEPSCLDLAGGLVGLFRSGRRDLSTNKRLLIQAVVSGTSRRRKRPQ